MPKNTAKKNTNVIDLRTAAGDFEIVYHRSHAGWIALDKTIDRLDAARSRHKKIGKKSQAEAMTAYVETRPHGEKATSMLKAFAECDRLTRLMATLRDATLECRGAADRAASNQPDMFDVGVGAPVKGMGWASLPTRKSIYSCLLAMESNGEQLDPYQAELLMDLGGPGVEALDFGLAASEAVEQDGAEADPTTDGEGAEDGDDLGF